MKSISIYTLLVAGWWPAAILAQTVAGTAPAAATAVKPALAAPVSTAPAPQPASPAPAATTMSPGKAALHPIQATASCDKTEYLHGQPGVTYSVAPTGTLKATLVLKNNTSSLHVLTYDTSQKFDFVIRDARGQEVKRWSANRMFAQIVTTVAIKGGEELHFTADLPLGEPGSPLPEGSYTLEGIATYSLDSGNQDSTALPANVDGRTSPKEPFKIIPTPAK